MKSSLHDGLGGLALPASKGRGGRTLAASEDRTGGATILGLGFGRGARVGATKAKGRTIGGGPGCDKVTGGTGGRTCTCNGAYLIDGIPKLIDGGPKLIDGSLNALNAFA